MEKKPIFRSVEDVSPYVPAHHAGTENRRLLGSPEDNAPLEVVHGLLQPGGVAAAHMHRHSDQFMYVLAGHARVRTGEIVRELHAGCFAFLPAGLPHQIDAIGTDPYEVLMMYVPPLGSSDTIPVVTGEVNQ